MRTVRDWRLPLSLAVLLAAVSPAPGSDLAFQFYFGGLTDVPVGAAGILVADQNGDGFLEPGSGEMEGLKLEAGRIVGPWDGDDRIVGVFAATGQGFGPGKAGFTGVVSRFKFDWRDPVPPGVPLKFFWFPDAGPGDRLGRWMRFGSFRRDETGTGGGTLGFFVPQPRHHEIIAAVTPDAPGGGDFDGVTGVRTGLIGIGDFTGQELPERQAEPDAPAEDPDTTLTGFADEFRGRYFGLVREAATDANLGEWGFTIGAGGVFSGRITVNRVGYRLRGRFDENGNYGTILDSSRAAEPLELILRLARSDGSGGLKIGGTVSGDSGLAGVIDGHRASFRRGTNPAPWAGRYTLLVPKTEDSPGGDGYALVTVADDGRITAKLRLGDYSPATDASYLSVDGEWPLSLLYGKRRLGKIAGKLTFRDLPESDFDGRLDWEKLPHPRERFFPEGFETTLTGIGSGFEAVPDELLIDTVGWGWRNVAVSFLGGITPNPGTLFAYWRRSDLRFESRVDDDQVLVLSANRKNGWITGSFRDRSEKMVVKFSGVAFQKQDIISGVANRYRTGEVAIFSFDPNDDD